MHIRTFRAANLNAALAMIREQMGADASVLHTRQVSGGMWRLLGQSKVEVTAGLRPRDSSGSATGSAAPPPPQGASTLAAGTRILRSGAEADLAEELNSAGLPQQIAAGWIQRSRHSALPATADWPDSPRGNLRAWLAGAIPTASPIRILEGRRRIVSLVGATGVGKTTTIAKLAARFRMDKRARVGLLTVDAFRAAAIDQLDAFARAMRVPMEVVRSIEEVPEALLRLGEVDLILVDTVGQSPRGAQRIAALGRLLRAIGPDETFLVLDANNSILAARDSLRAFDALSPTALILSKTDEVRQVAPALAPIIESGLGISYVTNGQIVPEDIAPADAEVLAKWASGLAVEGVSSVITTPRSDG